MHGLMARDGLCTAVFVWRPLHCPGVDRQAAAAQSMVECVSSICLHHTGLQQAWEACTHGTGTHTCACGRQLLCLVCGGVCNAEPFVMGGSLYV
jgi:hypothetical protein